MNEHLFVVLQLHMVTKLGHKHLVLVKKIYVNEALVHLLKLVPVANLLISDQVNVADIVPGSSWYRVVSPNLGRHRNDLVVLVLNVGEVTN